MKILTKEEEAAHYKYVPPTHTELRFCLTSQSKTLKGGIGGGIAGLAVGLAGVWGATRRYPAFRSLTLPLKAFLVTSSGTFTGKLFLFAVSASHVAVTRPKPNVEQGGRLGSTVRST